MKTLQHTITVNIKFLEHPGSYFPSSSKPSATNLAGKKIHHSVSKSCNLRCIIKLKVEVKIINIRKAHNRDRKFKHNFQDTFNPICNCGEDIETLCHYLLHCSLYTNERLASLNIIQGIDNSILELADSRIVEVLLYGRKWLDISSNNNILDATIDFLLETKRFDEGLF